MPQDSEVRRGDREFNDSEEGSDSPSTIGISVVRDVLIPLAIATVPNLCVYVAFRLVPMAFDRRDVPVETRRFILWTFTLLQLISLVWLSVLALLRWEQGSRNLWRLFPDGPPVWRNRCLFTGLCCLTLADVLAMVASIPGGEFMYWGALYVALGYLFLLWLAFFGAKEDAESF